MLTSDYLFDLPQNRIAQAPLPERTDARMMVLPRADDPSVSAGPPAHRLVRDIGEYLRPNDLLVVNDTRVIPARIFGHKTDTGGRVEALLLEETAPGVWDAMYRAAGRAAAGTRLTLGSGRIRAEIADVRSAGRVSLRMEADAPLLELLEQEGVPPLPPYIRRSPGGPAAPPAAETGAPPSPPPAGSALDRERYQTVYAAQPGAIAAPTAGLHFSRELLDRLQAAGVRLARVTLHVGPGTFRPVSAERVEDHAMEPERYSLPPETAEAVARARRDGGRVVAVGSTSVRVLETVAREDGSLAPGAGRTALFIRPPYRFRVVDAMLTNFHLPASTLLMMVCAFAGRERVLAAYAEAVRLEYRFYSYGDCMLIMGESGAREKKG